MTETEKIAWRENYYGNIHKGHEYKYEEIYENKKYRINQYKIDNPNWKSNDANHEEEVSSNKSRILFSPMPIEWMLNKEGETEAWELIRIFSSMLKNPKIERKELEMDIEYNAFPRYIPLTTEELENLKIEKSRLLLNLKKERPDLYENQEEN